MEVSIAAAHALLQCPAGVSKVWQMSSAWPQTCSMLVENCQGYQSSQIWR